MKSILEKYGKIVVVSIVIAIMIGAAALLRGGQIELPFQKITKLGSDEFTVASGGVVRPEEPKEAVDQVYCIYYEDGEMTISQNEIEPEAGRTVVKKGFYKTPKSCEKDMTTIRFVGAVKLKDCKCFFGGMNPSYCLYLREIKNLENLYIDKCEDAFMMFSVAFSLQNLDVSNFNTTNIKNMHGMFGFCHSLTSLDISSWNTDNVENMEKMFDLCDSLTEKGVKVSQKTYDKMLELATKNNKSFEEYIGKSEVYFDIVK